ncbi:MAG: hypothetical protein KY464_17965, partial [Gemmatimonadetes bacterium]|nr:hypothetical protein [Gemmatimonadota bacterium]
DSTLAAMAGVLLRTDLSQSRLITLVGGNAVHDALQRMRRPDGPRLDHALARELAIREGIPAVILPRLVAAGPRYVMVAEVVSADSGTVLTAVEAIAADSAAAVSAWRARELAEDEQRGVEATTLWGEAVLGWAEILRRQGTGSGLRRDDNELLRRSRQLVDQALAVPLPAALRTRAETLRTEIDRELRLGPLEWLPQRR